MIVTTEQTRGSDHKPDPKNFKKMNTQRVTFNTSELGQ